MLTEDDYVFVVGEPKALGAFEKKLGTRANYLRDVVMYGSPGIVRQVFKALKRLHVNTRISIESRSEAEALSRSHVCADNRFSQQTHLPSRRDAQTTELEVIE